MGQARQEMWITSGRGIARSSIPEVFGWIGLLLAIGCAAPAPSSPRTWMLDDGRTLAEWVEELPAAAVFVMNPDECLTCYSVLAPWLKARARHDGRLFLLFTRELGDGERRAIRTANIQEDGVIRT